MRPAPAALHRVARAWLGRLPLLLPALLPALLIALTCLWPAARATAQSGAPHVVGLSGFDRLIVRSGPGQDFDVVWNVHAGERVFLRERRGDWLRIEIANRPKIWGWVPGQFVLAMLDPAEWRVVRPTTTGYLNLRRGPGTGHEVIEEMAVGTRVFVLAAVGDWRFVAADGFRYGYAWGEPLIPAPSQPPAQLPRIGASGN